MEKVDLSDEELVEEAFAIMNSVDINNLTATTSESRLSTAEAESSVADDLLSAAIEAVRAAFSRSRPNWEIQKQRTGEDSNHNTDNTPVQASINQDRLDSASALDVFPGVVSRTEPSPANKRRKRMRERLIQLRAVVKKMEDHVETLKSLDSSRLEALEVERRNFMVDENDSKVANQLGEDADVVTMWKNIAMQQFRARRMAEHQNAELRKSLVAQFRLSKQVEELLQAQNLNSNLQVEDAQPSESK